MATATVSETSPLVPPTSTAAAAPKAPRTVTFNPHTTVAIVNGRKSTSVAPLAAPSSSAVHASPPPTPGPASLSGPSSKHKRRSSQIATGTAGGTSSKIGPQRTTKKAEKLKLLPNPDPADDGRDQESGRDVYAQFTRIKDPTARRDAARLGKADRERLPRVTAYCTASAYLLEALMKYLKARAKSRGAAPKLFDECIYTPYRYPDARDRVFDRAARMMGAGPAVPSQTPTQTQDRRHSDSELGQMMDRTSPRDLIDFEEEEGEGQPLPNGRRSAREHDGGEVGGAHATDLDTDVHTPEVFLFEYGTVVIWGMTVLQEQLFLKEISKFEKEKLAADDIQTENFNFYYTTEYQARIYNDFISLSDKKNYMIKLAISHALSQSVKTSLFEDLVDNTIEASKEIPERIARTGKVNLTRQQILMQVGELFILRINIHLQGSLLDSPEVMWAEPQLDPVYQAVRSYLEMDQRARLLTERLEVIGDLLTVLKDQLTHTHGEYLEWIVIILIAAEILVAAINIIVDIYAGKG
ncbi:MAG: hypothetical protein M1826_005096 [Phylliscum demangeonii]|nr:MAG: hypothetical protein M1826_005096 [Phylliscum demangeonii]